MLTIYNSLPLLRFPQILLTLGCAAVTYLGRDHDMASADRALLDQWPRSTDGQDWDGTNLLSLLRLNQNPFQETLDINSLMVEIEYTLSKEICDVPKVTHGANHFVSRLRPTPRPHVEDCELTRENIRDFTYCYEMPARWWPESHEGT